VLVAGSIRLGWAEESMVSEADGWLMGR